MSTSRALDAAIRKALDVPGLTNVVVDLDKVTFLDSTGIRTLIVGRSRAMERGAKFRIMNPSDVVRRVLEIAAVLPLLTEDA